MTTEPILVKTYLIYPKVLTGFSIDLWQANHTYKFHDIQLGFKIDGIKRIKCKKKV